MDKSIRREFRAHLELASGVTQKPLIVDLVGEDLEVVKERTQTLLNGKAKFEGAQSAVGTPGLTLIYHPNFGRGETVCGFIGQYDVPEAMSVSSAIGRLATEVAA